MVKVWLEKRWLRWMVAVAGLSVVGAGAWLVFGPEKDPVRERRYRAESACLLTGARGVRGSLAAPVWEGMQRASLETLVQVSFLSVPGEQTAQNAGTYLGGLLQGHCDLLVAVDEAPVAAVAQAAAKYPQQRFAVVKGASAANVAVMEPTSDAAHALIIGAFPQ